MLRIIARNVTKRQPMRSVELHGRAKAPIVSPSQAYLLLYPPIPGQVKTNMRSVSTPTRAVLFRTVLAGCILTIATAAQAVDERHKKYACTACHVDAKKLIGPSYQDVADRYRTNYRSDPTATIDKLALKVKRGGARAWGQLPMPPHGHVPDADIRQMVKSVLEMPAKK